MPSDSPPSYPAQSSNPSGFTDYAQKSAQDAKHSNAAQAQYYVQNPTSTGGGYQLNQLHSSPSAGGSGTLGPAVPPPPQQPQPYGAYPQQQIYAGQPQPQQVWTSQPIQQPGHAVLIQPGQPQQYVVAPPNVTVLSAGGPRYCEPGQHIFRTEYGACGIIAAVLLFPIGLLFLLCDQRKWCVKCGAVG